jgi:D-arabinose 1-dehydrogenase-like Zn-dependent alcohol dehydrogenase
VSLTGTLTAPWHLTPSTDDVDEARRWFDEFESAGCDGIVAKRRDGAYAEYICLPARNLLPVRGDLGTIEATVAIDALATPLHICRRAEVQAAERVLVIGAAGGVGIHLVQVLGLRGAQVFAVDRRDKLEAVREHSPDAVLLPAEEDWAAAVAREIDVAVDFVGRQETHEAAVTALDRGGRLVVLTVATEAPVAITNRALVGGELSVLGSKYASHAELLAAADLLARGAVQPVISTRGDLASVADQLAAIGEGRVIGRGVLDLT